MATIGTFSRVGNGLAGSIKTATLNIKSVTFAPAESNTENGPAFRVLAGTTAFGAAWKKTSRELHEYHSVKLDDPSFPAPIYASLVATDTEGEFALIWSRRLAAS